MKNSVYLSYSWKYVCLAVAKQRLHLLLALFQLCVVMSQYALSSLPEHEHFAIRRSFAHSQL
jgi:hypothetical protein